MEVLLLHFQLWKPVLLFKREWMGCLYLIWTDAQHFTWWIRYEKAERALDAAFAHYWSKTSIKHFTIMSWAFQARKGFFTTCYYCRRNLGSPLHSGDKTTVKEVDCKGRTKEDKSNSVGFASNGHSFLGFPWDNFCGLFGKTITGGLYWIITTFGQGNQKRLCVCVCNIHTFLIFFNLYIIEFIYINTI